MSLQFVKREILSSSDGLSHGESRSVGEAVESKSSGLSLFEQLSAQKEKEKEAYDAKTKLIFAPPQGLDDGDVDFFTEQERKKVRSDDEKVQVEAFVAETKRLERKEEPNRKKKANTTPRIEDDYFVKLKKKPRIQLVDYDDDDSSGDDG